MAKVVFFQTLLLLLCGSCSVGGDLEPGAEAVAEVRAEEPAYDYLVYVGTYTGESSQGIYACRLDTDSGQMTAPELVAPSRNPSFLAVHPNQRFLYAVNEVRDEGNGEGGTVEAFEIDPGTGQLKLLNRVSSRGEWPCHLNLDRTGQMLVLANYLNGTVAGFAVGEDGRLSEATTVVQHRGSSVHPTRQRGPHAHSVDFSPDNRFLMSADLGLDRVLIYRVDIDQGKVLPNDPAFAKVIAGAGPRHFAFHPSAPYAFVLNELQSTVTAFGYDSRRGALEAQQTISMLPQGTDTESTGAELEIHPSGRFLYASNRGHDSLAIFGIDTQSGSLTHLGNAATLGRRPRSFGIDPNGAYLLAANQDTDNVVVFRIDKESGRLTATGQQVSIDSPVCVKFVPL